jgi:hypothetical protein
VCLSATQVGEPWPWLEKFSTWNFCGVLIVDVQIVGGDPCQFGAAVEEKAVETELVAFDRLNTMPSTVGSTGC